MGKIKKEKILSGAMYIVLVLLYLVATVIVIQVARSDEMLPVGQGFIPYSAFAGVFTSVANICVVLIVVYYNKIGFITSFILLICQFPGLFINIFFKHTLASIPGLFSNIFAVIAIILLHINYMRIEKYQKKLLEQAITDRLTGIPNRFACTELVENLIAQDEKFAVVAIDLNHFKSINDTMGRNTGNEVLTEIASRWKKAVESGKSGTLDYITRQGGDEFALIIRKYASDKEIMRTIQYYQKMLENKITADDCDFFITGSFGYAEYPADAGTTDALFTYADTAMTEIKRMNSSNRIMHFTPELLKIERTLEIERIIRNALENDLIFFNLQPQYDMSHKLRGFEVLARMKDAEGNPLSPNEFIPVAEKVGLIDKLDGAVFRKSAVFFGGLIKKYHSDIMLSVNASVRHLMKNDFLDEVREILKISGIPAGQLEIEITESIMIDSAEKALQCINEIKNMGIKIAIDDFGTGYSSLSYLYKFPANLLKIDKAFIDKMNTSESSRQYVAAIISIGHIMGFEVISEGVEEPEQLETLQNIGCDFIQGFVWGHPLLEKEAEKLVQASVNQH